MVGCVRSVTGNGQSRYTGKSSRVPSISTPWFVQEERYVIVLNADVHSRYILQMNVMDHTGQFWITAFNEVAEQLMGVSANDLQQRKDTGDENGFNKAFQDCMGRTFTFQMIAKQDSYNVRPTLSYLALPDSELS